VPRIGSAAAPDLAQWRQGALRQQLAQRLTMPEDGQITSVGAWLRGVSGYGSIAFRLVVWAWDGSVSGTNRVLGQSAQLSASAAAFAIGSLEKRTAALESPVELAAGSQFLVGISSDTAGGTACQWGLATGGTHYAKDLQTANAWPAKMSNCYSESESLSAWVENYDAVGAAWIWRGGAWVQADSVQIWRAGAWVPATSVQIWRGGAWVDAG